AAPVSASTPTAAPPSAAAAAAPAACVAPIAASGASCRRYRAASRRTSRCAWSSGHGVSSPGSAAPPAPPRLVCASLAVFVVLVLVFLVPLATVASLRFRSGAVGSVTGPRRRGAHGPATQPTGPYRSSYQSVSAIWEEPPAPAIAAATGSCFS